MLARRRLAGEIILAATSDERAAVAQESGAEASRRPAGANARCGARPGDESMDKMRGSGL